MFRLSVLLLTYGHSDYATGGHDICMVYPGRHGLHGRVRRGRKPDQCDGHLGQYDSVRSGCDSYLQRDADDIRLYRQYIYGEHGSGAYGDDRATDRWGDDMQRYSIHIYPCGDLAKYSDSTKHDIFLVSAIGDSRYHGRCLSRTRSGHIDRYAEQ